MNLCDMRVLWVSLVKFPPLCELLGEASPVHCGWLYSSAKALIVGDKVELGVAIPTYEDRFSEYDVGGITYYLVPVKSIAKYGKHSLAYCKQVIEEFNPQVIHLHGTEYSLAAAFCEANDKKCRIIANIQGLASVYARYTHASMSLWERLLNVSPLDFLRGTFMLREKKVMSRRGRNECCILTKVTDVIGRTSWDKAHAMTINPEVKYHFMNETLRDVFYEAPVWDYAQCQRYSIFVSNSNPAYKGAHMVLKALPIILKSFPDAKVFFIGQDVLSSNPKEILRFQGYHVYLRRLIKKLKLSGYVHFYGSLSAYEMKQAFLNTHVYVLPSAIENSPNSLCEAQILGVPVVSSYCGGTSDLVEHGLTGYIYRYEEYEMLAHLVMNIFKQESYEELSCAEREVAMLRHDRRVNAKRLVEIYNNCI